MEIILYSTHCPKCKVIETKLKQAGLQYTEIDDVEKMLSLGIRMAPMLEVNGKLMDFSDANRFLKGVQMPDGCNQCEVK